MADTVRTLTALQALLADNTSGDISPQDARDHLITSRLFSGARPVDGDFSWVNQGSATITTAFDGTLVLTSPADTGTNLRCRVQSAPSTPYTITCELDYALLAVNYHAVGLVFRQSSDGKLETFGPATDSTSKLKIQRYNTATSFSANVTAEGLVGYPRFLRIADNGTNRILSFSTDGTTFVQYASHGRTTFLTADEVGFYVNGETNSGGPWACQMKINSWVEG